MTTAVPKKTLYLRGVPAKIVRDAKIEAARRGSTLTAYVSDALERACTQGHDRGPAEHTLDADERWYEGNRGRLLSTYAGQYVAISDGRVVDHDAEFGELAQRVFRRLGPRPVFMPRVGSNDRFHVRSPRVRKR